jgi:hypothetical protein
MKTIEYKTMDKTGWGPGPWQEEPDKVQWQDPATSYPCLVVRNRSGAFCGYVGVSPGHWAYGKDYEDVPADAHGGLTFAGKCQPGGEDSGVCHVVEGGEEDRVWWLGFDCIHSGDHAPAYEYLTAFLSGEYRDLGYVKDQVLNLATQLRVLDKGIGKVLDLGAKL